MATNRLTIPSRLTWFALALWSACLPSFAFAEDVELLEEQAMQAAVQRATPSALKIETVGGTETVGAMLVGTGPTTGVAVSEDGYIVSSSFNFVQKPASILVTLPSGQRAVAELIATDHSKKLVLLKVKPDKPLPVPEGVPVKEMQVGQWALALGRTYEGDKPSLSVGIISAVNRVWGKAIQTDAKVSPGNYGGPLIDIRGRVLGVLAPLSPQSNEELAGVEWYDSGIGFAVPFSDIQAMLPRWKKGEDLYQGLLGVSMKGTDLSTEAAEISVVQPNSPAYKAGLKPGDKIIELDGKPLANQAQMKHALSPRYAGEKVKLTVTRGKDRLEKEVELIAKLTPYQHPFLGVLPLRDPRAADAPGIVVREALPGGPAAKADVKAGDRIISVEGQAATSRAALVEQIASLAPGHKLAVEIRRGAETKKLEIPLGTLPEGIPSNVPPARAENKEPAAGEKPVVGVIKLKVPDAPNECLAYVPENYDPALVYGVVVWLHAPGGFKDEELVARWKKLCDDNDLILLAPKSADPTKWQKNEVPFLRKFLDDVTKNYRVDKARIVAHGQEGGGAMAYLLAFANRDAIRGVAVVDSPMPAAPPAPLNEPVFPLAFYSAHAPKSNAAKGIDAGVQKLRNLKYPVTTKSLAEPSKYLSADELAELVRWIDSLDRI